MAEAVGFAASVAGLIGFAGQIVQGCLFVKELFGDIKNAPNDIKSLVSEIEILSTSARTTDSLIRQIGTSNPEFIGDGVEPALRQCSELVDEIKQVLDKNKGYISRQGVTKVWGSMRVAFGKKKFDSYLARLERTKSQMISIQENISLSMHNDHRTNHLNIAPAIQQISESDRTQITVVEELRADVSLVKNNHNDFRERLQNIESLIVQMHSRSELPNIEGLRNSAITRALSEHRKSLPAVRDNGHIVDSIDGNSGVINNEDHLTHCPRVLPSKLVSKAITGRRRRTKLFWSYHRNFLFDISVKTSETVEASENSDPPNEQRRLETSIDIRTKIPYWRRRFVVEVVKPLVRSANSFGMTLNTYNIIPRDAPLWDACRTFDLDKMRELFNSGLASPYDQKSYWPYGWTLCDEIIIKRRDYTHDVDELNKYVGMIQYLAHCLGNTLYHRIICTILDTHKYIRSPLSGFEIQALRWTEQEPPVDITSVGFNMDLQLQNSAMGDLIPKDSWILELNECDEYPGFYIENDRQMLSDPPGTFMEQAICNGLKYHPWVNQLYDRYPNQFGGLDAIHRLLFLHQISPYQEVKECCQKRIAILAKHGYNFMQPVFIDFIQFGDSTYTSAILYTISCGLEDMLCDCLQLAGFQRSETQDLFDEERYYGVPELLEGNITYLSRDYCRRDFISNLCSGAYAGLQEEQCRIEARQLICNIGLEYEYAVTDMIRSANSALLQRSTPGGWPEEKSLVPGIDFILPLQYGKYKNGTELEDVEEWPCVREILEKEGVDRRDIKYWI